MAAYFPKTYDKLWITDFFHNFPHIDFSFVVVNSTFDPKDDTYKQALGFWALVPVAVCFLFWLVFLCYFIFRCCQQQRKSKECSSQCPRIVTLLLILMGAALVGFGFYENESAHSGVRDVRSRRHDVNDILITANHRVDTLEQLADDVSTRLSQALTAAAAGITNSTVRNMALKLISEIHQQAVDSRDYLSKVTIDAASDGTLEDIFSFEYFRWMITIVVFCLYLVIFLLWLIGLLVRSKGTLITSTTVAVVCSFFLWLAAGVYLSLSVATGDLCMDPDAYFIGVAEGSTAEVAMAAYIKCKDPSQPYSQVIDNAVTAVSSARVALNRTAFIAQPYTVPGMDQIVSEMDSDLQSSIGNLSLLLQNVGRCPTIHNLYVSGVNSVCTSTTTALAFLSLVCCLLATVCTILIFCVSCVWRQCAKQRLQSEYVCTDDKDPFLPHPPAYETDYGTMGQSSPRPWSERSDLQQPNAPSSDDQVMTLMYQPPYPSDESPPPAYHPGQFVQRYAMSGPPTTSSTRPYSVK